MDDLEENNPGYKAKRRREHVKRLYTDIALRAQPGRDQSVLLPRALTRNERQR